MENQIEKFDPILLAEQLGVEKKQATEISSGLSTILEEREILIEQYKQVMTLEITQENLSTFAELRKQIKNNRTSGIVKWHKTNKEYWLAGGRFVDALKNKHIAESERMEEQLLNAEQHFERIEEEKRTKIRDERFRLLSQYTEIAAIYPLDVISDDAFQELLESSKLSYERKQEEIRKEEERKIEEAKKQQLHAERRELAIPYYQFWSDFEKTINFGEQSESDFNAFMDRLKKAKSDEDEKQKAVQAENDRLRREAEDKEKALAAERKKQQEEADKKEKELQAELQAMREAQEKAEKELEAKRKSDMDAEIAKEKEAERLRKEAEELAAAPIKDQLNAWIDAFAINPRPNDSMVAVGIEAKFKGFIKWAKEEVSKL